ncbi:hypothetical protein JYU34_021681 [Plutella xylostella]|uniref:Uncharacterized protein n=1 Tax=Plutella xylostella TaxID=51655 RepID=A0ABQ7PSU3_PLUXY|nr:hypothetical protein JYU34_021681 [Plutella xylostella]
MTKENKTNWKCDVCVSKKVPVCTTTSTPQTSTASSSKTNNLTKTPADYHVTTRKKQNDSNTQNETSL